MRKQAKRFLNPRFIYRVFASQTVDVDDTKSDKPYNSGTSAQQGGPDLVCSWLLCKHRHIFYSSEEIIFQSREVVFVSTFPPNSQIQCFQERLRGAEFSRKPEVHQQGESVLELS